MEQSTPSDRVKRAAREAGAIACRITSALPDEAARRSMREAFERGDLATWPYDGRYARAASSPDSLLPGAKSVICTAFAYATPPPSYAPLEGRVSNYAWSRDYHDRMHAALRAIAAVVDDLAGRPASAIACDTKPLAERAFAARAGLGWIGKHTNLIAPGAGSFVFLGEIVTTLDLDSDPPLKKTCGTCARCVGACPTGALRGDYTIDARRCIADLTQRTDAIPRELRSLIGTWVWGCDLCQAACPPTMRAPWSMDAADRPASRAAAAPSLTALLELRSGTYKRAYKRTAIGWRGAAVLRRNAAVALGNALDRAAVPALARALRSDPHPLVRGHAAWALGRIGSPSAFIALRAAQQTENDEGVLEELACALSTEPGATAAR